MNTFRFSFIASLAGAAGFATLLSATPPVIGPNVRVNSILGPDATASTVDDDDPNDQSSVKAHNTTTVTFIRSEGDPILFGAWSDRSWYDVTGQGESNGFSVGFGADDLGLSWPVHDIARGEDEEPDDLPPPTGGGPSDWQELQTTPKAAVIPPQSSVAGVYLVGIDEGLEGRRLWIASSDDGATGWSTITAVWEPNDPNEGIRIIRNPYLTVWMDEDDPNDVEVHMLLTWTQEPSGAEGGLERIMFSISDDSGDTFSAPARMSDPDVPPDHAGFTDYSASAFGSGPGGDSVYVVWYQEPGFSESLDPLPLTIKWRRYSTSTENWSPQIGTNGAVVAEILPVHVFPFILDPDTTPLNFALHDQASVVVDHSPGRVGAVYVAFANVIEKTDPFTRIDPDIFVATLRPGESDFEAPVKVNNDLPIPFGGFANIYMPTVQFMPWVAATDQGHVGVGWYDRRDHVDVDENGEDFNRKHHYYFAYSIDGGRNFSDNEQVSEEQSDPVPASGVNTEVLMGAFTSIGGVHSSIVPLWVDLRDWDPLEDFDDRLGDVYSAEIRICEGNAPDGDNDCDVDLTDFALFAQCYSASPTPEHCLTWDFDFNGDVDNTDYARFGQAFTGSLTPCDWGCEEEESSGGPTLEELLEDEEVQVLYEELQAYCEEHGIPFS